MALVIYTAQAGRHNRLGHSQRRINPPVDSYATSTSRFGPSGDGFELPNLPKPSLPKLPKLPSGFGPPDDTYGAPSSSGYGVQEEEADLSPFIAMALVVLGLSLLFPEIVTINDVRRKRSATAEDFVGRSTEIYDHLNAALEPVDRGCMEKITCEAGILAADAGYTSNPVLR